MTSKIALMAARARAEARAAAMLERQGVSAGVARERDWRQLFINGARQSKSSSKCRRYHKRALLSNGRGSNEPWAAHRTGEAGT